jgi:prepilin-type N-terminal cleavage/methylation domain-containing protein
MKTIPKKLSKASAFTIVELLVVIAIIGILAAMLLPVIGIAVTSAKKTKAKLEINQIGTAIQKYESDYSRLPVSTTVEHSGWTNVTYGGTNYINSSGTVWPATPTTYLTYIPSNSEVISILMDYTNFPGNTTMFTANTNYQKNPQQNIFLSASLSGNSSGPGVGTDLNYRDPWGNLYIITLDLNEDQNCEDPFYSPVVVSSSTGMAGGPGVNGLVYQAPIGGVGTGSYSYHGNYMVWSMGPNGPFNQSPSSFGFGPSAPTDGSLCWALDSANKNHLLSWQQ